MSRKNLGSVLTLLVLLSFIVSACQPAAPAPAPAPPADAPAVEAPAAEAPAAPAAQAPAGEKAKVVIFVGMGTGTAPSQVAGQEELQRKFNAAHDDIEIEFMIVPHDEAPERFLAMVSGGNAPQLVGPNGTSTIAQFLDNWEDITPFLQADNYDMSDFYGPVIELNKFPGKNVGLPLGIYPSMLFYNKDHFDAAGLEYLGTDYNDTSWTMDKLREYSMKLTLDANDNDATSPDFDPAKIEQWGYDDSWISGRGYLAGWGAADVGRPTSSDFMTATANSDEWVYGAQWLSDGIWVDRFIPDLAGQEAYYAVAGDPFGSQMVSIFNSHTWFFAEGLVDLPFEYAVAPAPYNHKGTRVQRIHADNFTIPKDAKNKEEAWYVMKWLADPENIVEVCLVYGCLPARESAEQDFKNILSERYPLVDLDVVYTAIDYLDNPHHESWVPEWARIEDVINNAMSNIYSGVNKDGKAVMDEANAEIQTILDSYWSKQ
jgi:multiple sugar transport system substrate-binding protein